MTPYRYVPGSTVDKVLKALDVAAVPISLTTLRDAIEYEGDVKKLRQMLRRPTILDVIRYENRLYSRGETPTVLRERRAGGYVRLSKESWRGHLPEPSAMVGSLRTMMDVGSTVATGDPLRALADALDAARKVLSAKPGTRFNGAEVDLLVARELRSITVAAQLATQTLNEALEVLL